MKLKVYSIIYSHDFYTFTKEALPTEDFRYIPYSICKICPMVKVFDKWQEHLYETDIYIYVYKLLEYRGYGGLKPVSRLHKVFWDWHDMTLDEFRLEKKGVILKEESPTENKANLVE